MHQQLEHTKRIQSKLQGLVKELTGLRKENAELKQQAAGWQEKLASQTSLINQLTEQLELLKMNTGKGWDDATREAMEKRLQQYIKEIDRCLAMLND